jgi:hypothetical protein
MRVAYCFSGYLRRFWDNPTLLEHVLRRAPGDLFVHTWDTLNYAGSTWHGDNGLALVPVDAEVLDVLSGQYGTFARLVLEHPPAFPAPLMPVIQARYSCWRSNRLKAEREQELGARTTSFSISASISSSTTRSTFPRRSYQESCIVWRTATA